MMCLFCDTTSSHSPDLDFTFSGCDKVRNEEILPIGFVAKCSAELVPFVADEDGEFGKVGGLWYLRPNDKTVTKCCVGVFSSRCVEPHVWLNEGVGLSVLCDVSHDC